MFRSIGQASPLPPRVSRSKVRRCCSGRLESDRGSSSSRESFLKVPGLRAGRQHPLWSGLLPKVRNAEMLRVGATYPWPAPLEFDIFRHAAHATRAAISAQLQVPSKSNRGNMR